MKFLVDANLPYKLALSLINNGYDAIHTDNLPNKEQTSDYEIFEKAYLEDRIIITKDTDFLNSFIIHKKPKKLLLITTGNISIKYLAKLFENYFEAIVDLFGSYNYIEMTNEQIIVHEI